MKLAKRSRQINIDSPMTAVMLQALQLANNNGGKLQRYPGGFWNVAGLTDAASISRGSFPARTILSLLERGRVAISRNQVSAGVKFMVEVIITERGTQVLQPATEQQQ
jgi:hypothetical protein